MHRVSPSLGALVGGLMAAALIAVLYVGRQVAGLPFVPFDVVDWLARVLPGRVITVGIDAMIRLIGALGLGPTSSVAKSLERLLGIVLVLGAGAVAGVAVAWAARRTRATWKAGAAVGAVVLVPVLALERAHGAGALVWLAAAVLTWGVVSGQLVAPVPERPGQTAQESASLARRRAARTLGGSLVFALVAWGLGRGLGSGFSRRRVDSGAGRPLAGIPPPAALDVQAGPSEVVPGTRAAITPNSRFYRIDIDTSPPVLEEARWSLTPQGLFDRPRSLGLKDIMARPPVTLAITQECISNPVGGDLVGTTRYTGARLRDLLVEMGLRPSARALQLEAADGFYESVTMADMLDPRTLLVYGMNGETLPIEHGFPLRIYIPNRYGMKQPKWITRMEAIDHDGRGYWVDRGWSKEARPQITSVIDTVAVERAEGGRIPVGGIAWAGDRGIQGVQIQVDGGPWSDARIVPPLVGPLAWSLWRYDWPAQRGRHTFRVRAIDGTGTFQVEKQEDPYPDGATGYYSVTVSV